MNASDELDILYGSAPCELRIQKKLALKAATELFYPAETKKKVEEAQTIGEINRAMRDARNAEWLFGKENKNGNQGNNEAGSTYTNGIVGVEGRYHY